MVIHPWAPLETTLSSWHMLKSQQKVCKAGEHSIHLQEAAGTEELVLYRMRDGAFYSYCSTVFLDKGGANKAHHQPANGGKQATHTGLLLGSNWAPSPFCAPRRGEKGNNL